MAEILYLYPITTISLLIAFSVCLAVVLFGFVKQVLVSMARKKRRAEMRKLRQKRRRAERENEYECYIALALNCADKALLNIK